MHASERRVRGQSLQSHGGTRGNLRCPRVHRRHTTEAAAGADIVIATLADNAASRSTWLGPHGALAGTQPRTVAIESSTLLGRVGEGT
jgi:hypothetical protein